MAWIVRLYKDGRIKQSLEKYPPEEKRNDRNSSKAPIEVFESCDRCGARAKVGATFLNGELYLLWTSRKDFTTALDCESDNYL
jgi:hypothetical protein